MRVEGDGEESDKTGRRPRERGVSEAEEEVRMKEKGEEEKRNEILKMGRGR